MKLKSAFTLIELLVMIVIIGILATLATTSLKVVVGKARDGRRMSDIASIRKALEIYKLNNETYPPDNQFIVGAPLKSGTDLAIGKIPTNPKAVDGACAINEYLYHQDNSGLSYHINWCLGTQVQDAGPGPCIATPNHYCSLCTNGSCTGKCGGENGCGQPCPTVNCAIVSPARPICSPTFSCVECIGTTLATNDCSGGKVCSNGTCVSGNCMQDTDCGSCQKCANNVCTNQTASEDLKNECGTSNCFTGDCSGSGSCGVYNDSQPHNCSLSGGYDNRGCVGNVDGSCTCVPSACGGTNGRCNQSNGCGGTCGASCSNSNKDSSGNICACSSDNYCHPAAVVATLPNGTYHSNYCSTCGLTANSPYQICGNNTQEIGCACCPAACGDSMLLCQNACRALGNGWDVINVATNLGTKTCDNNSHYDDTNPLHQPHGNGGSQSCLCTKTQCVQ